MRINYQASIVNNIQNNNLANSIRIINKTYSDNFKSTNVSAKLEISNKSLDEYFEKGLFDNIVKDAKYNNYFIENDTVSTNDILQKFGEKYSEVYEKVMKNATDDKKAEYLEKLDNAFEKAVELQSDTMLKNFNKLFKENNISSTLDTKSFKESFIQVANVIKDYYLENSNENINDYISSKIDFKVKNNFKSYKAFSSVMDFFDYSKEISEKMNWLKGVFIDNSCDDITNSKKLFDDIHNSLEYIQNTLDKLTEIRTNINDSDISDNLKNGLLEAIDNKISSLNDMNGKMQKYTEYLEKYQKIQEKIKKAIAKRDALNAKLDKANEAKNQDLVSMYLKKVASADSELAKLNAKSAEIESQMANLIKEIKETEIK
ncbi:MAG: hypothetical protein N4A63_09305 [Vallitalea sp.]|jgi:hypothetical protein|nr:hypothetical protein [Vallitalea sp.]